MSKIDIKNQEYLKTILLTRTSYSRPPTKIFSSKGEGINTIFLITDQENKFFFFLVLESDWATEMPRNQKVFCSLYMS